MALDLLAIWKCNNNTFSKYSCSLMTFSCCINTVTLEAIQHSVVMVPSNLQSQFTSSTALSIAAAAETLMNRTASSLLMATNYNTGAILQPPRPTSTAPPIFLLSLNRRFRTFPPALNRSLLPLNRNVHLPSSGASITSAVRYWTLPPHPNNYWCSCLHQKQEQHSSVASPACEADEG